MVPLANAGYVEHKSLPGSDHPLPGDAFADLISYPATQIRFLTDLPSSGYVKLLSRIPLCQNTFSSGWYIRMRSVSTTEQDEINVSGAKLRVV